MTYNIRVVKGCGMTAKDLIKLLVANGWYEAREQKGSHKIFKHKDSDCTIPVPMHSGKDLAIGTLHSILKKAGLK